MNNMSSTGGGDSERGGLLEAEPELLSEVPPILKRLAKTVAYAFYDAELIVLVCLLTKHSVVDEDTLCERLQFDKRQLRQALSRLKADKLIKQRTIKEKVQETGNFNVFNFYFINYKVFVNVVKYKLDHIRKKLETEEQQSRNRPSFQCQDCETTFSDLEVDRLLDPATGDFVCTFCKGIVAEDASQIQVNSNGSSLARFNEQLEPIFKLLAACENINLAPHILEPTPSTENLKNKTVGQAKTGTQGNAKSGWSDSRTGVNLYDQTMQVNIGDEVGEAAAKAATTGKEQPVWMSHSTVMEPAAAATVVKQEVTTTVPAGASVGNIQFPSASVMKGVIAERRDMPEISAAAQDDIMSDLLACESASTANQSSGDPSPSQSSVHTEDSDPDSELFTDHKQDHKQDIMRTNDIALPVEVASMESDDEDDEDEDDEIRLHIGGKAVLLSDVSEEMISSMTPEEHEAYTKAYHDAYEQYF